MFKATVTPNGVSLPSCYWSGCSRRVSEGAGVGPWSVSSLLVSHCGCHVLQLGQLRTVTPREAVWPSENGSHVSVFLIRVPTLPAQTK